MATIHCRTLPQSGSVVHRCTVRYDDTLSVLSSTAVPEKYVIVVAEHTGMLGERLEVFVGWQRCVGERNVSVKPLRLGSAFHEPEKVQEHRWHR